MSLPTAGMAVSAAASVWAAAGLHEVVRQTAGGKAATFAVALWAATPVGIVQSMAYSEALFTALAAWTLVKAAQERWVAAGLLAAAAGLTRPVGVAVTLALVAAASRNFLRTPSGCSLQWVRPLAGTLIAVTGAAAYPSWVGWHAGSGVLGYFDVQQAWGNGFDGGVTFAVFVGRLIVGPGIAGGLLLCAGILLVIRAYLRGFSLRLPLPVQVYTGTVIILAFGASGYFGSKPRLLLPAFSILVPLATRLTRTGRLYSIGAVVLLVLSSALYGAFWLNGSGPP